jgi:putative membrane protein
MLLLLRWLLSALGLMLVAYLIPGIGVAGFYTALIAALVLGLINAIIRPVIKILSLPINILTLGLFSLVINALLFWLVSTIVKGFVVTGFWPAFWGALIMSVVGWFANSVLKKDKE